MATIVEMLRLVTVWRQPWVSLGAVNLLPSRVGFVNPTRPEFVPWTGFSSDWRRFVNPTRRELVVPPTGFRSDWRRFGKHATLLLATSALLKQNEPRGSVFCGGDGDENENTKVSHIYIHTYFY